MCGRYALAYPPAEVARRLIQNGLPVDEEPLEGEVNNRYNIAPGSCQPVYRAVGGQQDSVDSPDDANNGTTVKYGLKAMKWGFTLPSSPHFTINTRDTTLDAPNSPWTPLKHTHRCLIPAQGFFEWRQSGPQRTPHFVKRRDGNLMLFAGLWTPDTSDSTWPGGKYTIITTSAAPQLTFLHERMPVILEPEEAKEWLDPTLRWRPKLMNMCVPWKGELEVYVVPAEVGNVKNEEARFVEPVKGIESFFGKAVKRDTNEVETVVESEESGIKSEEKEVGETKTEEKNSLKKEDSKPPNTTPTDEGEWEYWPEAYEVPPCSDMENNASNLFPSETAENDAMNPTTSLKRPHSPDDTSSPTPPAKAAKTPWVRSATSNAANRRTPTGGKKKPKAKDGTQKITSFFKK